MAAGWQSRAEARRSGEATARARTARPGDQAARRPEPGGPAFISEQAEEQYHLDQLHDPLADPLTRSMARIELARLYERRGQFSEAVEMYERNVWAGVRTPATYAGLASAYRQLGRNDLADAALEQVRREGGAATAATNTATATTAVLPATRASGRASSTRQSAQRMGSLQPRAGAVRNSAMTTATPTSGRRPVAARADFVGQLKQLVAPIMANEIGRRTVVASSVLLPIAVGVAIFATVVMTSTRSRATDPAPAPTAAPVATVAPTAAPAPPPAPPAAPAALSQPPAAARLVVRNVGAEGLTLRRSPGVGEKIKVWNDGTEMADLGDAADHSGRSWKKVRDPNGNVGWAAADFLGDPAAAGAATTASLSAGARPVQASAPFASGGLGLSRAEWEQINGQPTRSSIFLEYANGKLVVGLLEGNVWHLERAWPRSEPVALDAARDEARAYLVSDAVLVQSVDRGDGRIIDVYSSAILGNRFGATAWNGGRTGTFSIQYRFRTAADRMVTSAMFRLGDVLF